MVTQPVEGQPQAEAPTPEAPEATESQGSFLDDLTVDPEADSTEATTEAEAPTEAESGTALPRTSANTTAATDTSAAPTADLPPLATTPVPNGEAQQRQRMAQLELENQHLVALQADAQLETQKAQYQQNLEQQGHSYDTAQVIADHWVQSRREIANHKQQIDGAAQETQAKIQSAQLIATQHGIDAQALMAYDTPNAMASAAKSMAENKNLKARLERLEKAQVPPQTFDSSQSAGKSVGRDSLRDRYAEGAELTREELNILFE